ncbi:DUF6090 family protein [uncultured Maribacter sp.]|uniref:DUF6090 family protein n=1 Tax=uncultured Maribacter sp. TaxID=431308 RepID=UPI0030DB772D|tara:strand:+ start:92 stop:856 length:765 start_codon:yes stop_codon:yes gene_type:complete
MIKFFRKIRQKMLIENKFSKYLIYAIGEIILVVIGILIALAINNSNQNRVIQKKEQTYLNGLKAEFQTSKFKLSELIKINKSNFYGAKKLLEDISNKNESPSEKQFSELLLNTFSSDISFNPNNSLLSEMISSGSLKDISNTNLRIKLTNWISTIEDISKQESELGIQREKVLDIFRTNENSLRTIFDLTGISQEIGLQKMEQSVSNLDLLKSRKFENNILMFILTTNAMEKAHYEPLMKDLESIMELIENEIK